MHTHIRAYVCIHNIIYLYIRLISFQKQIEIYKYYQLHILATSVIVNEEHKQMHINHYITV